MAAGFDGLDWAAGDKGSRHRRCRAFGDSGPRDLPLHEPVAEDIATDPSGTYVVTREALYRIRANDSGRPRIVWRREVSRSATSTGWRAGSIPVRARHPSSWTGSYVAVADAMNPPHVQVHDIADGGAHCDPPCL